MPSITASSVITGTAQLGDQVVETADIKDDAVTLAKLAAGTAGGVIVYDASGNPADLGAGSSGQVIKSQGAGAAPQWNSASAPPTVQVFTADGTWTKPAGLSAVIVEAWGAGGGSGHQENISNEYLEGGGAGAYSRKRIVAASLGATETVTVGVGGPAGAATGANGSNGEDTTFGTHLTAGGGTGGKGSDNTSGTASGATGGTATGGDVNIPGGNGGPSVIYDADTRQGGHGGQAPFAAFTYGAFGSDVVSAAAGKFPGGGASGCGQGSSSGAVAGAAGADGLVIVTEFY